MIFKNKTAIANTTAEIIMNYLNSRIIFLIRCLMCLLGTNNMISTQQHFKGLTPFRTTEVD